MLTATWPPLTATWPPPDRPDAAGPAPGSATLQS